MVTYIEQILKILAHEMWQMPILGQPLKQHEMPLMFLNGSLTFDISAIDFIGPFQNTSHRIGEKYTITTVEYVTKWTKSQPFESCTK